ncbi:hypothetical protein [Butyricimonas sp. Marseille-P3923]|uniref:hypothetical protein n=1 Tax=Butyricimonas sp. Marseille-P3923 TaxID=1987504 RepID=UPI001145CA8C|nr:hypothetical protein [Butyricimonas sp. Marseille-P3923]
MKLLKHIGFLLFILLSLNSCVNEMDIIEDEQELEVLGSRGFPPTRPNYEEWVKNLIDYKESGLVDRSSLSKLESSLQFIYLNFPEIRVLIDDMINRGIKFRLVIGNKNDKDSWFDPEKSEIGFKPNRFKLGNIVHELLHFLGFHTIDAYQKGRWAAREEYEVRVLTDLFMRRAGVLSHDYQGIVGYDNYLEYLKWLDKILANDVNLFYFKKDFIRFARPLICTIQDSNIRVEELDDYDLLLMDFWFYDKF